MRRSKQTKYVTLDSEIWEYKNNYYIMQMCQQGKVLHPKIGSNQMPGEYTCVSTKTPTDTEAGQLGKATLKALDDFDVQVHPYEVVDIPERNKIIASWFCARGMGSLIKNVRVVQVIQIIEAGMIKVRPLDGRDKNNWNCPIEEEAIEIKYSEANIDQLLGEAIKAAFAVTPYSPERKDPI
ncbi:hypothetical protein E8K88_17825 [Lampropedia aestuarii]|uniref:DUF1436 family protein n=1 Tax=Lampropedia aestuarii TaxID=2562762 RepID=A0A4S5BK96_9BURK|nr:hypothetical protein [Lampropedia aestuarii]THJ30098.1 hypothetical protein E8K88_17825 [Lampropedia aestuarii]